MSNKIRLRLAARTFLSVCAVGAMLTVSPCLCARSEESTMDFRNRIQRIQEEVIDLTSPSALFDSHLFLEVWQKPEKYVDNVKVFLADSKVTDTKKEIAALSLQSLPLGDFVNFCDYVIRLRTEGKITNKVFYKAIFPGYDWNTKLQENFRNPEVRRLLLRLREIVSGPNKGVHEYDKKYVDEILSGEADFHIKDLRSAGQIR